MIFDFGEMENVVKKLSGLGFLRKLNIAFLKVSGKFQANLKMELSGHYTSIFVQKTINAQIAWFYRLPFGYNYLTIEDWLIAVIRSFLLLRPFFGKPAHVKTVAWSCDF